MDLYLDRLDQYIEQTLLPVHDQGARRTPYRLYMRLWQRALTGSNSKETATAAEHCASR